MEAICKGSRQLLQQHADYLHSFVCTHWLERTIPRLEKRPPRDVYAIVIQYLSRSYAGRGRLWPERYTSNILEAAGQDCTKEGASIVWNRTSATPAS